MVRKRFSSSESLSEEENMQQVKRPKIVPTKTPRNFETDVKSVDELKDDFIAVSNAHIQGSTIFAVHSDDMLNAELPCLPLVSISNFGVLPTPVSKSIFDELKAKMLDGKSGNTTQSPNSVYMDQAVIGFTNAKFIEDFGVLLDNEIAPKLGLTNMKLYSKFQGVTIQGPGSELMTHLFDSSKTNDAFGVVLVILPSIYSANDSIKVCYKTKENVFECNKLTESTGCSYLAFFSDCHVDLGTLSDGYLSYLVYFICQSEVGIRPIPFSENESKTRLWNVLQEYMFSVDTPVLCWALEDNYYEEDSYNWWNGYSYTKTQNFLSDENWLNESDGKVLSLLKRVLAYDKEQHGKTRYHLYLVAAEMTKHNQVCECGCPEWDYPNGCEHTDYYTEKGRSMLFKKFLPLTASTFNIDTYYFKIESSEPNNQLINFDLGVEDRFWDTKGTNCIMTTGSGNRSYSKLAFVILRTDCSLELKFKSDPCEGLNHLKQLLLANNVEEARQGMDIVLPLTHDFNEAFKKASKLTDIIFICGALKDKARFLTALLNLEKHGICDKEAATVLGEAISQFDASHDAREAFIKFIKTCHPLNYNYLIHCCSLVKFIKPVEVTEILINILSSNINESNLDLKYGFGNLYTPPIIEFMVSAKTATEDNAFFLCNLLTAHLIIEKLILVAIQKNDCIIYKALLDRVKNEEMLEEGADDLSGLVSFITTLQSNQKMEDCLDFLDHQLPFITTVADLYELWKVYLKKCSVPEKRVLEMIGRRMSNLMVESSV